MQINVQHQQGNSDMDDFDDEGNEVQGVRVIDSQKVILKSKFDDGGGGKKEKSNWDDDDEE